jgi:transposase
MRGIGKMKDGRTALSYKAEHGVDLDSQAIVAVNVARASEADPSTGSQTLVEAQNKLLQAGSEVCISQVVADKGYHDNGLLDLCRKVSVRTYIPERRKKTRRWTDKPEGYEESFRANRRRARSAKGKRLNRQRSEICERSFAHLCETGGGRRSWLRGLENVSKSYLLRCAAYNLALLLRKAFGLSKPRNLAAAWGLVSALLRWFLGLLHSISRLHVHFSASSPNHEPQIPEYL